MVKSPVTRFSTYLKFSLVAALGIFSFWAVAAVVPTTLAATTSYTFTHDLSLGVDEYDVLMLQKFLNESGFTIAASGVGSLGNETTYFGAKTKEALIRFQQANGIDPTGYFGPATRQFIASSVVTKTATTQRVTQAVLESRTFQHGVGGYTGGVDNEISDDNPTSVYNVGGSTYSNRMGIRVCGSACNKVLVRFGNLNLNPADTITNIQLQLKVSGTQGGSGSLMAHKVSRSDWSTSAVTWNSYKTGTAWTTAGGDTTGSAVSVPAVGAEAWVTFDLGTNYTVAELEQNGIIISSNIPGYNFLWVYSNEDSSTANRPKLVVTYSTTNPTAPTAAPTVAISASPTSVASGGSATVTWSSTNATDCTVTGGRTGTSGSFSTGALTTSATYTATCTGAGGSDTQSTTVSVGTQTTPVTDTTAPTAPTNLTATPASMSQVNLAWTAATDNVGVTGYRVYRGTALAATLGAVTAYQDTGRTANTAYTYSVRALDAAGNVSPASASVSATTLSGATLTPPAGGLQIDLSYVNQSSPEFTRFKSVVDAALAGSPDYGFEPQHAALMSKITGDVRYCDFAVQYAESCPNSYENRYGISCGVQGAERSIAAGGQPYVAGDSYLEVGPIIGSLAITYDWCNARMTDAQKTRWKNYADQAIYNVWHPSQATWGGRSYPWTGWSIDNPGNNYYYSFLEASMFWALASRDANLYTFVRNEKLQPLINYYAQIPGGGSLEGTGYGAAQMRLFHLYQVWKDSTGEDIGNLSPHMNDSIRFWVHATTPNRAYYAPIGDLSRSSFPDLFDYHRRLILQARLLSTNTASRDLASWWLNNISVGQMSRRIDSQWDMMPEGSFTAATPNEPLSYRATGIGRVFARTGWDTNALWMSFAAGKYAESHAHQDQGSFTLANNAWLAVTNNIYSNSGIEQTTNYHNILRFVQNGSIVPQREGNEAVMTVNQLAANGDIDVTGNITPVYGGSSAVQNWTRNVRFASRKLTVTDNFTTGAGTQAIFQINTPAQPVVSGNLITAGNLRVRVSTPASPTIQVVNLEGHYRIDISGGTNSYVVELSDQDITGTTPTPTPTPTPTSTTPVSTKFTVGGRVITTDNVNVRATANTAGSLLGTQTTGSLGTVVAGPTAQGGYNWWSINYDSGADGWSVEDYLSTYTAPTTPTPTPTPTTPSTGTLSMVFNPINANDPADAPLVKFAETWARNWNFEGHSVPDPFSTNSGYWNYGETVYEPWLFDRTSVGYYLYKRTGDVKWRTQFLSDFAYYRAHIDASGIFTPKGAGDTKYSYITPFLLYEKETGDTQYRPIAERIYNAWASDFPNTYSAGLALWTEREIGLALEAAVSWYELTGSQAALTRANALVAQWTQVSGTAGVPLVTVDQHEGGGGSQLVTSPWMSALYFQAAYRLYNLTGNTAVLQQVSRYADWMEQYGYFNGSVIGSVSAGIIAPYYLVGPTGPYDPETPSAGDFGHCLDVSSILRFAIDAKQVLGQSTAAVTARNAQLRTCAAYDFADLTRTTTSLPKYRVNPPRKFNWQMRSAIAFSGTTNTTPTTPVVTDTTAPTVAVTAPTASATISGPAVAFVAAATDAVGVTGVQFRVSGTAVGPEDTTAPYSLTWDSTSVADGSYTISAVARDATGNTSTSAGVPVTVRNAVTVTDTTAPTVALTAPLAGVTLSGTAAAVSATAADNIGVAGVTFFVDGVAMPEDTSYPYGALFNTTSYQNGSHTISARARDAAGNIANTPTVTVSVSNTVATPSDTIAPTVPLNLAGTARSSSQIDLTWTHSIDNVAVSGYTVERCTGSSCTNFVRLGDVTANAYGDTGLAAGTTYRYRLMARDAAGNRSAYTSPLSVTTLARTSGGGGGGGGGGKKPKVAPKSSAWLTPEPTTVTTVTTPTYTTTSQTSFTKSLYVGLQDPEVTKLQNYLIKLGYLASDAATGFYGRQTEAAVMKYQCAKNIVCTGTGASTGYGLVGAATRAKLNQEMGVSTPALTGDKVALLQSLLQQLAVLQAMLKQVRGY